MSPTPAGGTQRAHILDVALSLMAQKGVDGTSMRDLAGAAGLNVASLYHYFPSKRDLLVAVLDERGILAEGFDSGPQQLDGSLTEVMDAILQSMLEVEDFIRLMLGEVMRGQETARVVGSELMSATHEFLGAWLEEHKVVEGDAEPMARLIRTMVIGLFFEYVAGQLAGEDPSVAFRRRAVEAAQLLERG